MLMTSTDLSVALHVGTNIIAAESDADEDQSKFTKSIGKRNAQETLIRRILLWERFVKRFVVIYLQRTMNAEPVKAWYTFSGKWSDQQLTAGYHGRAAQRSCSGY